MDVQMNNTAMKDKLFLELNLVYNIRLTYNNHIVMISLF